MNRSSIPYYLFAFLLIIFSFLLLKSILNSQIHHPIYIWDEAIYANNALEMAANNNFLVYTRDGQPDHYNTKPPLVLWLQALSFKTFGYYEWALRLPSFLALLGIVILFFIFYKRNQLHWCVPLIGTLATLTCLGIIRPHVFLSGDLDGVLVFFASAIFFVRLDELGQNNKRHHTQILMCFLFILGYLTKSTAILLLLPSLVVSLVFDHQLIPLFKKSSLYYCALAFVIIIASYYLVREHYDPGYFQIVYFSEFKRYTSNIMEWHQQPFFFYFENILFHTNKYYSLLTGVIAIPFFYLHETKHKKIVVHICLMMLTYLITISIPRVKLDWYDAPIYPIWAFALSIMIFESMQKLIQHSSIKIIHVLVPMVFAGLLIWPALKTHSSIHALYSNFQPLEQEATILQSIDQELNKNKYTVLMDVEDNKTMHFDALNFYIKSFYLNQKKTVQLKRHVSEISVHDTIIVVQQNKIDSLKQIFHLHQVNHLFNHYFSIEEKTFDR